MAVCLSCDDHDAAEGTCSSCGVQTFDLADVVSVTVPFGVLRMFTAMAERFAAGLIPEQRGNTLAVVYAAADMIADQLPPDGPPLTLTAAVARVRLAEWEHAAG